MDIRSRPPRGLEFPCLCLLLSDIAFPTCLCTVPIYQDPNQSCGVFAIPFTFVISSLSAGNPAPQADGGSPYIDLTCIIPHLNIVLTIKFGSFYLLEVFLRLREVHLTLSISATFNISHLNIVLTIIFGSFLFAALKPGLLLGSLQKQIAGVLKRQRSVPNSCQRASCHLLW